MKELENLAKENKISIFNYRDNIPVPSTKDEFESEEDNIILRLAVITNSILITGDKVLASKAKREQRPTIYIQDLSQLNNRLK